MQIKFSVNTNENLLLRSTEISIFLNVKHFPLFHVLLWFNLIIIIIIHTKTRKNCLIDHRPQSTLFTTGKKTSSNESDYIFDKKKCQQDKKVKVNKRLYTYTYLYNITFHVLLGIQNILRS